MALDAQFAESIKQVEVTFGFSHFDCDPEDITSGLGITPDEVRRRGEQLPARGGRFVTVPFNAWSISSKTKSKDVNDHCREVLKRLAAAVGRLDARWRVPSFNVLYKATHLCGGNGPFFEVDVVKGIAALGAELWQDIYSLEEITPK
jgi:hypothetical protein